MKRISFVFLVPLVAFFLHLSTEAFTVKTTSFALRRNVSLNRKCRSGSLLTMRDASASYWFKVGDSVKVVDDVSKSGVNLRNRVGRVIETWEKCDVDPTCCCAEQVDIGMAVRVEFSGTELNAEAEGSSFKHYFAEAELETIQQQTKGDLASRRSVLASTLATATVSLCIQPDDAMAVSSNGLPLKTASSGLKWADAKVGTGNPLKLGNVASIDYSMASTVGRLPQIYSTKDKGAPYRWTLGDGTTIAGIEEAILGSDEIVPMLPGGIRRVIIPAKLGYESILENPNPKICVEGKSVGPIPPKNSDGGYNRWYQFYCNPRIPYQPDLVFDIKLYGAR